jgi:hypothetical protein
LMAAELFGVKSLARTMSIIQPIDSFGQTMFPYLIAHLRQYFGNYAQALHAVFGLALVGAIAILLLPQPARDATETPVAAPDPTGAPR